MKIEFKFKPGDFVETPFKHMGLVETCAVNQTGSIIYSVETAAAIGEGTTFRWYAEELLKPWHKEGPVV